MSDSIPNWVRKTHLNTLLCSVFPVLSYWQLHLFSCLSQKPHHWPVSFSHISHLSGRQILSARFSEHSRIWSLFILPLPPLTCNHLSPGLLQWSLTILFFISSVYSKYKLEFLLDMGKIMCLFFMTLQWAFSSQNKKAEGDMTHYSKRYLFSLRIILN